MRFPTRGGPVRGVESVDFHVAAAKTLGVVGESGSCKTVSSLSLLRLVAPPTRITAGCIVFEGEDLVTALPASPPSAAGASQ